MKVSMFRVEKPCGSGPYMDDSDNPLLAHMNAVHGDEDHPEPWDDPMLEQIYPDEQCGFPTLCAVETWFAGYEDALDECGYSIVCYTVPRQYVRYGLKQAVFLKEHAVPVRTLAMR